MAYIKDIKPNTIDSHQVSPAYVLTFLRWDNRDTFNYEGEGALKVRNPLVVYNDAISVVTNKTKAAPQGTCNIVLKNGDINYATAVHPGDYFMVNMVNWDKDAQKLRDRVTAKKYINGYSHGFKGVYKISGVTKSVTMGATGAKEYITTVTGKSFSEFNNIIYYNNALATEFKESSGLYQLLIGEFYQERLAEKYEISKILPDLFQILIGKINNDASSSFPSHGSTQYKIPKEMSWLLGRTTANYASDIFNLAVGIWGASRKFGTTGASFNSPFTSQSSENILKTMKPLQGEKRVGVENWNKQTAWSILKSMSHDVLNEMYTTDRVGPNDKIYPTLIIRQKPFTTPHFQAPTSFDVTEFFSLPRWRVDANLLKSFSTSKNESLRFNFVQVFSGYKDISNECNFSSQIVAKNFISDDGDVSRNGLRPYVVTSWFDLPDSAVKQSAAGNTFRSPEWTKIVSDWVINGHLKENGTFQFKGIVEPIAVGDNFEFDGVLYHIEGVSHSVKISRNGNKSFDTTLTVSYGMDLRSDSDNPVYSQMQYTDYWTEQKKDWANNRILPGVGEDQHITGRDKGVEINKTQEISFTGAPKKDKAKVSDNTNTGNNEIKKSEDYQEVDDFFNKK